MASGAAVSFLGVLGVTCDTTEAGVSRNTTAAGEGVDLNSEVLNEIILSVKQHYSQETWFDLPGKTKHIFLS